MSAAVEDPRIIEFDVRTDEMLVNMGPQHPSTHGVLRLVLRTDGEIVSEVVPHIGYLHRCAEKIGENLTPRQWIPYTDRMDYLSAMNNNYGYVLAVEKMLGLEIPERAQVIRVIMSELQRLASHLFWLGTHSLDLAGAGLSVFMYATRERERILDLFVMACGARLTTSYIRIGGVWRDLPPAFVNNLSDFIKIMPKGMPPQKVSVCSPKQWTEPPDGADERRRCTNFDFKMDGPKATWKVSCAGPPAMTGDGEITRDGDDAFAGAIRFASSEAAMTVKLQGRRIGDCEKPQ